MPFFKLTLSFLKAVIRSKMKQTRQLSIHTMKNDDYRIFKSNDSNTCMYRLFNFDKRQRRSISSKISAQKSKNSNEPKSNGVLNGFLRSYNRKKLTLSAIAIIMTGTGATFMFYKTLVNSQTENQLLSNSEDFIKEPTNVKDIPQHVPYILIGGGVASFSAFKAIKTIDTHAKVLMINEEPYLPYLRPPLSKEFWFFSEFNNIRNMTFLSWNGNNRRIFLEPNEFYVRSKDLMNSEYGGLGIMLGWKVNKIDTEEKKVYLENGQTIQYEKCLIATGSRPKNLKIFEEANDFVKSRVITYNSIADLKKLHNNMDNINSLVIVGGGLLATELACSISNFALANNKKVYQIMSEDSNLSKTVPECLSQLIRNRLNKFHVNVISNTKIIKVREQFGSVELTLSSGQIVNADQVIVAIGSIPNTNIVSNPNFEIDDINGGFKTNSELQIATDVYAAGDCLSYHDQKFGRRRVESYDNALHSGKQAGKNMAGESRPYTHQSILWSDLGPDIGFESIGLTDSSLKTVSIFTTVSKDNNPNNSPEIQSDLEAEITNQIIRDASVKTNPSASYNDIENGIIFYLKDDKIVGLFLWNVYQKTFIAKHIIEHGYSSNDIIHLAKLFDLTDTE